MFVYSFILLSNKLLIQNLFITISILKFLIYIFILYPFKKTLSRSSKKDCFDSFTQANRILEQNFQGHIENIHNFLTSFIIKNQFNCYITLFLFLSLCFLQLSSENKNTKLLKKTTKPTFSFLYMYLFKKQYIT